jgi:hypothetical protein
MGGGPMVAKLSEVAVARSIGTLFLFWMFLSTPVRAGNGNYPSGFVPLGEQKQNGSGPVYGEKTYPPKDVSEISGRCIVRQEIPLETPCTKTQVLLLGGNGKLIDTRELTQGTFSFPVEKDKTYYVTADSAHYRPPGRLGPFKGGDQVILKLAPIPK